MNRVALGAGIVALTCGAVSGMVEQESGARAGSPAGSLSIDALIDIRHPSNPVWSPDGRRIFFSWERAGVAAFYVAEADARTPPRELKAASGSTGAFWSRDSQALYVSKGGDFWRVPLDGTDAVPLWTTPQIESNIVLSPDGSRIAFVRFAGGGRGARSGGASAGSELWTRTTDAGVEALVTRQESPITAVTWSPDGRHLAFGAGAGTLRHEQTPSYSGAKIIYTVTERTPGQTYVVSSEGGPPVPVGSRGGFGGVRWLDAGHVVFDRTAPDFKRRTIYVASITGGDPRVAHEDIDEKFWSMTGDAGAAGQPSPDGKWIAFVSDRDGWDHIYVMPAGGGAPVQITKGKFEAWRPTWSRDSTRIAFDANGAGQPGTRHLGIADLGTDPARAKVTMITEGRGTNIAPTWSPDGTRLVFQHTDSQHSADLFVVTARAASAPVRLTDSMPSSIDKAALTEPQLVHYAGPDGQQIPAWLSVPRNLDRSKKHPAIVWIHGDGVNQNYDGWHVQRNYAVYYSFHQYLLQQGYVVIAPDYRGSIGYGKAWRQGVYMDVGGQDAKDAWMAANHLKSLSYVDTERIGVWGLSYGGFFTLIAMTDQPRLFRCGIDVAGVVDYAMYYEDPYHGGWTASRIGTPEQNPQVYAKASPVTNIRRLERPLLVLHGTADVNVPYLHSVRLIDEVLRQGKGRLVEFMTYPGEFHYFQREHVLRDAWTRADEFFNRQLRGVSGQTPPAH